MLKTWGPCPISLNCVCPSSWGTPVTHFTVWAAHLSVWSTVPLQMVGGCYVMSLERYFLVGCWKEGKPQPCFRRRLWNFVRVNSVNQHPLSLRLAPEDNLQGLLRSLSLRKEIENIKCVCFVWGGERWGEVSGTLPTVKEIIFRALFSSYRWPLFKNHNIDYLTFAFLWYLGTMTIRRKSEKEFGYVY